MSDILYDLWYEREYQDRSDTCLRIGIFSSREDAMKAMESLKSKPGFSSFTEGFEIHEIAVGRISWEGGFTTRYFERTESFDKEAVDLPV
jgi:hypothetical protein